MNNTNNDFYKNTPTPYDDAFGTLMNDFIQFLIPALTKSSANIILAMRKSFSD